MSSRLRAYGESVDLALVDPVLAEPTRDAPRLALADDLTRRGDPMGAALQAAVGHENGRFRAEDVVALGARFDAWVGEIAELAWHRGDSTAPRGHGPRSFALRRGFVEVVHLRDDGAASQGEALIATWPVRALYIDGRGNRSVGVRDLPVHAFGRVESLFINGMAIDDDGAEWLAARPELAGLAHIDLQHNGIGERGIEALYASAHLREARRVELDGNVVPLLEAFSDYDGFGGSVHEIRWTSLAHRLVAAHGRRAWLPDDGAPA